VIVADWPEDISHFCMLLVTGPGEIAPVGSMRFEFVASPGFSTAMNSQCRTTPFTTRVRCAISCCSGWTRWALYPIFRPFLFIDRGGGSAQADHRLAEG
jgi:hypothetical protein